MRCVKRMKMAKRVFWQASRAGLEPATEIVLQRGGLAQTAPPSSEVAVAAEASREVAQVNVGSELERLFGTSCVW